MATKILTICQVILCKPTSDTEIFCIFMSFWNVNQFMKFFKIYFFFLLLLKILLFDKAYGVKTTLQFNSLFNFYEFWNVNRLLWHSLNYFFLHGKFHFLTNLIYTQMTIVNFNVFLIKFIFGSFWNFLILLPQKN